MKVLLNVIQDCRNGVVTFPMLSDQLEGDMQWMI